MIVAGFLIAVVCLTVLFASPKPVYGDTPADHDAWTENTASQWYYDTNRGTLTADSSVKQVGSYSLKAAKNPNTGWQYMQYPSAHNLALDLTGYAGLRFYIREDTGLGVVVRLYTSDGNYYQRTVSLAAPNTWYLQDLPVGSGWTIVGSPNWASINFIEFGSASSSGSAQLMYIDGVYFYTGAVTTTTPVTTTTAGPQISFNVRSGAAQIIVTVIWTGSGSATIQLVDPSSTTYDEASGVIYEKLTVNVAGGTSTTTHLKRVTFSSGIVSGTWTLKLTLSGISDYAANIEIA